MLSFKSKFVNNLQYFDKYLFLNNFFYLNLQKFYKNVIKF
jgi:hypothetical protein